jgi:hypothetical protein
MNIPSYSCSPFDEYRFDIPKNLSNYTICPVTSIVNSTSLNFQLDQINFSYARNDNYPVAMLKMTEY